MSLFNRLVGKKPPAPAPLDPAALITAFQQFVMAGTWTESQHIVEQQPILLHPRPTTSCGSWPPPRMTPGYVTWWRSTASCCTAAAR